LAAAARPQEHGTLNDFINLTLPELGDWVYWIVFAMTFLETSAFVGLMVPGEVTLLIAGLLASQGMLHLWGLIIIASIGAILGDSAGYWIGRSGGVKVLRRYGRYFLFKEKYLDTTEKYFQAHGGKTVLFGRFVGVVRSFGPVVAGISRMPYGTFLLYDIIGAILSVTLVLVLGFFFGESWRLVSDVLGWGGAVVFGLIVALAVGIALWRRWRRSEAGET